VGVGPWTDDLVEPGGACSLGRLERSTHRPHLAGQAEFPAEHPPLEPRRRDDLIGGEDAEREDEVEPGSLLAHVRRSKVRRDPLHRVVVAGVSDGTAHPVARLLHGGVRQPDDREHRESVVDVDLDADGNRIDAVEHRTPSAREHAQPFRGSSREVPEDPSSRQGQTARTGSLKLRGQEPRLLG
jgi:hypothetical protein